MSEPIRIHPDNPMRFLWRGKATFLLGATEHYGALLNSAFDYERYFDTLAGDGLTLTRAFTFYRELEDSLGPEIGYENTLAPRPERYLAPWARVADSTDVGPDGLPKFDLDTWDDRYFTRLRGFISAAAARGVVVEVVFFCHTYDDRRWQHFPLHPASNVNGVGKDAASHREFLTLSAPSVVEHQRRLVRKLVAETNEFDNLYYEVCNEPGYARPTGQPDAEAVRDWQREIVRTVRETERSLPKRHIVAVNPHMALPTRAQSAVDDRRVYVLDDGFYLRDPGIDLVNVHYIGAREPRAGLSHFYTGGARNTTYRFGSVAAFVALRAAAGKPISFDETHTGMLGRQVPSPMQNRLEAWESLIGGCAAYDHLDFTFTPTDPTGSAAGEVPAALARKWFDGSPLRRQFSCLVKYAAGLNLVALRPDLLTVQQTPTGVGAVAARSTDAGVKTIAVYLADLRPFSLHFGTTALGGTLCLGGATPNAGYAVRALDPKTGEWVELPPITADGYGDLRVEVPAFREDLLVHFERGG